MTTAAITVSLSLAALLIAYTGWVLHQASEPADRQHRAYRALTAAWDAISAAVAAPFYWTKRRQP